MNNTTNLGLGKPLGSEDYDVNVFNNNADILDKVIHSAEVKIDSLLNSAVISNSSEITKAVMQDCMYEKAYIVNCNDSDIVPTGATISNYWHIIYIPAHKGAVYGCQIAVSYNYKGVYMRQGNVGGWESWKCINSGREIIIATYDTESEAKGIASYICKKNKAGTTINKAIASAKKGDKIVLLDGTYEVDAIINIDKAITVEGTGNKTVLKQYLNKYNTANTIFYINSADVVIKNMMLSDVSIGSTNPMIVANEQNFNVSNVFFILNDTLGACVMGSSGKNVAYSRICNCRVYKSFNDASVAMFNFSRSSFYKGVISGNISSGYNNISVSFANDSDRANTAIYGHTAIDIV